MVENPGIKARKHLWCEILKLAKSLVQVLIWVLDVSGKK